MKTNNRQWIILDRDGTLINDAGYLSDPAGVRLMPRVAEGLRLLAAAGCRFVVVTNQSGVGRGFFSRDDMDAVNARLVEILSGEYIKIERIYCCVHTPEDACSCRKPQVGLVRLAQRELGFTASQIRCVVGDKACDTELAGNLQVDSVLLRGPGTENAARGTFEARDFLEAAEIILSMDGG